MNYDELVNLRQMNVAWILLRADNAPLIISFLHKTFIEPNKRDIAKNILENLLEDELFKLRDRNQDLFPKKASEYITDWQKSGYLRNFYVDNDDEPHYDISAKAEKAIQWIDDLISKKFVGTESRLRTIFSLVEQIVIGSDRNKENRLENLEKQKQTLEAEIEKLKAGNVSILSDSEIKDRFQQVISLSNMMLSDFREVEDNFRKLDQATREKIATSDGAKGEVLETQFKDFDYIESTDEGKSFKAFMQFIMSQDKIDDFDEKLAKILEMKQIKELKPDKKIAKIYRNWQKAGESTQKMVIKLTQRLSRYVSQNISSQNKSIERLIKRIENMAIKLKTIANNDKNYMDIDKAGIELSMPMELPLWTSSEKPNIVSDIEIGLENDIDDSALYNQVFVDKQSIIDNIRKALNLNEQTTLGQVINNNPLNKGLMELISYFSVASEMQNNRQINIICDNSSKEEIKWLDESLQAIRVAKIPKITISYEK